MKITFLLILCGLMTVSAAVKSQDVKISLKVKSTSISNVLKEIEKKTDYRFVYNNSLFPGEKKVTISADNKTVGDVLKELFNSTGYNYQLLGGGVIVLVKEQQEAAAHTVSGTVVDNNDQPMPGVTVKIKGQPLSAVSTNDKGFFSIRVPENSILEITFIGFAKQEINVGSQTTLQIKLNPELGALSEVVIVGYGKQSKATITSSVAAVDGADLVKVPAPNITQSLAGRLPGLIAVNNYGQPGNDNATLYIRGLSTIGDNSPIIVIDGVVRSNFQGSVNALSYLDPNDIESISILKDAAATAVYGARAANGAILVTTKRGKEGTTSITYTGNFGTQHAAQLVKPLDSYTTAQMWNVGWQNDGAFAPTYLGSRGYNDAALAAIQNGTDPNRFGNTDWYHVVYGNSAAQQSHNVSINGGTSRNSYFVSAGIFDQDGFYSASGLKRYNARANLDGKLLNIFDFTLNVSGRKEYRNSSYSDPTSIALLSTPLEPIQYTNGTYSYNQSWIGNAALIANGTGGYNNAVNSNFESSATLTYHVPFVPGLSVKGLFSYDDYFIQSKAFNTPYLTYRLNDDNTFSVPAAVSAALPSLYQTNSEYQSTTSEASLNYNHTFGNHSVSGLLLYTETRNQGQVLSASRVNFPSAALDQLNLGSPTGLNNGGSGIQSARRGIVGRLNYNFKERYLFEFDARYDGSDLFPPSKRYGFFPAVSAGWRLSEEKFFKENFSFINNFKLRGSWGQAGNDRAAAFQYLNSYTIQVAQGGSANTSFGGGYSFGGANASAGQAILPGVIANPSFTWEKATTTNIGLDANLWHNLLGITADYFHKRTSNVLTANTAAIPAVIGGSLPVGNYGTVDNNGFELQLTHQNKIGKVSYFINPNITFNRSKVISYPDAASTPAALRLTGKQVQPGTLITGYVANGLYQSQDQITGGPTPLYASTKPGDIRYVDVDGDGKITPSDKVIISNGSVPNYMFGLNLGASYKNFDVTAFFQGAAGVKDVIPSPLAWSSYGSIPIAFPLQQDYWTPTNTGATYPRLTVTSQNNHDASSFWVRNGSYVRMKNFELGYTLPVQWLHKLSITNTRIFVNGTNLFTLSHLKGIMDPETLVYYPLVRVFSAGVSVKF